MSSCSTPLNPPLHCVAVDLTPMLPGALNGGAKVVALELVRGLAAEFPHCQFELLTRQSSHDELAPMEAANVRRHLTVRDGAPHSGGPGLPPWATGIRHVPGNVLSPLLGLAFRLRDAARGWRRPHRLRGLRAQLLYCPFTAVRHAEPGIAVVSTVHDLQFRSYPQFFQPEDVAYRDHGFRQACMRATVVTAVSEYARQMAIRHGKLDPERIRTILLRLAGRLPAASTPPAALLQSLDLSPGRYLVYPANFWRHKNHEMLLTAFGAAAAGALPPDVRLVCTGAPGERQRWLQGVAQAMGLGGRVMFPGFLPEGELGQLLRHSAGTVFPSLYEGFGLPVLEAMAAGTAVACSDRTSLPEVAGNAALLFDPRRPAAIADAMLRLVLDPGLRQQLQAAGSARVAQFSDPRQMVREYWQAFQDALALAQPALPASAGVAS